MIGELHVTFVFESATHATRGWERVASRCALISVNRWAPNPNDMKRQAVTVLCEDEPEMRPQFEKACALLRRSGGIEKPTPGGTLEILRAKRVRTAAAGGHRRTVRTPQGTILSKEGTLGPFRRPQG